MTIKITFNGIDFMCEYKDTFLISAVPILRCDILPALSASTGIHNELVRLVKEAHRKEYREEL